MLNSYKHARSVFAGCLCLVSLLTGCSSYIADREQGFTMIERGFSGLEATPGLYREIRLESVKVIIVGDREQFKWQKAAAKDSAIIGYATPHNEIWIFGKVVDGRIVINEAVIGHELVHLLNFQDATIANPDRLQELNKLQTVAVGKK